MLSVRSGSAFSMPGMMDTILNVGLNMPLLEAMDDGSERAWGAWDCYRRYLQNVAMSCGADRDLFDDVMIRHKEKHRVDIKLEFTAAQMKEMALEYREVGERQGVSFVDDPVEQLMQAIFLVLDSWDSEPARLYRRQLGLADGWGTAVIVQRMVFGNMNRESGSGVVVHHQPALVDHRHRAFRRLHPVLAGRGRGRRSGVAVADQRTPAQGVLAQRRGLVGDRVPGDLRQRSERSLSNSSTSTATSTRRSSSLSSRARPTGSFCCRPVRCATPAPATSRSSPTRRSSRSTCSVRGSGSAVAPCRDGRRSPKRMSSDCAPPTPENG